MQSSHRWTPSCSLSSCFIDTQGLCASLRSHPIYPHTQICTGGCRQTADVTSTESSGITCTLDQRCQIELDTPLGSLGPRAIQQDTTSVITRRGLGSVAFQLLLRVDDNQSDLLSLALSSTNSCSAFTSLHKCYCCHCRRVASERGVPPSHPNPWYGSAHRTYIVKFHSPVRPARHLQPSQESDAHQREARGNRVRFAFCILDVASMVFTETAPVDRGGTKSCKVKRVEALFDRQRCHVRFVSAGPGWNFPNPRKLILASRARSFCRLDAADRRATARGGVLRLGTGIACTSGVVVALHLPTTQCATLWPRGELQGSPNDDHLLCWIVAPPALTTSAVSGR